MANFVTEFLPQTISLEQGFLASAHRGEENTEAKSIGIELAPKGHKIIKIHLEV